MDPQRTSTGLAAALAVAQDSLETTRQLLARAQHELDQIPLSSRGGAFREAQADIDTTLLDNRRRSELLASACITDERSFIALLQQAQPQGTTRSGLAGRSP